MAARAELQENLLDPYNVYWNVGKPTSSHDVHFDIDGKLYSSCSACKKIHSRRLIQARKGSSAMDKVSNVFHRLYNSINEQVSVKWLALLILIVAAIAAIVLLV